jgi:hypothetical protein
VPQKLKVASEEIIGASNSANLENTKKKFPNPNKSLKKTVM